MINAYYQLFDYPFFLINMDFINDCPYNCFLFDPALYLDASIKEIRY